MKKILGIIAILLIISANLYAGNGDLNVEGNAGVGITASVNSAFKLHLHNPVSKWTYLHLTHKTSGVGDNDGFMVALEDKTGALYGGAGTSINLQAGGNGRSNLIVRDTGNIGIGVVLPLALFNVVGQGVDKVNGSCPSGYDLYSDGGGQCRMTSLLVTSGGNVGIGTTTPAAKFQVSGGDAYTSTAGNGLIVKSPNGTICKRIGIDDSGNIVAASVTCP